MTSKMVESVWVSMVYIRHYLDPDIRKITRKLANLHLKFLKRKQSVVTNRICFYEVDLFSKNNAPEVYFHYVDDTFCMFGVRLRRASFSHI